MVLRYRPQASLQRTRRSRLALSPTQEVSCRGGHGLRQGPEALALKAPEDVHWLQAVGHVELSGSQRRNVGPSSTSGALAVWSRTAERTFCVARGLQSKASIPPRGDVRLVGLALATCRIGAASKRPSHAQLLCSVSEGVWQSMETARHAATWHIKSLHAPRRGCCEVHAPVRPRARTTAWLSASVRATVVTKASGHKLSRCAHMLGTRVCRRCAFGGVVFLVWPQSPFTETAPHQALTVLTDTASLARRSNAALSGPRPWTARAWLKMPPTTAAGFLEQKPRVGAASTAGPRTPLPLPSAPSSSTAA